MASAPSTVGRHRRQERQHQRDQGFVRCRLRADDLRLSNGRFTYLAEPIDGGDKEENFDYTLKDKDGDTDSANLIVCIQDKDVDTQPIADDNHDALTESSVSGAATVLNEFNGGGTGGTVYGGGSQSSSESC